MYSNYIHQFNNILQQLQITSSNNQSLSEDALLKLLTRKLNDVKLSGKTLYLVGNGGSNSIVSHASVDFINTCGINAIPLTDSSQLTCFANDFGYEQVFSKHLEICIKQNDILIAVSSSGSSKNILNAVYKAREKEAFIITLSGFKSDNPLRISGDINFWLNSNHYGMVEIGHSLILHYISDFYSNKLIF